MGQSHNSCCGQVPSKKDCLHSDHIYSPSGYSQERRESGNDSGNSSAESLSPNREPRIQRCSQSSESSGKFSFRGSISSPAESEAQNKSNCKNSAPACEDLPVFSEGNESDEIALNQEVLVHKKRRSLSVIGQKSTRFFRTKSASVSSHPWSRTVEEEQEETSEGRPRRAVSLRLPRSQQHPKNKDTKVPTVYVDEEEEEAPSARTRRRSSLREALSLLSLNSLTRELNSSSGSSKAQKPVQKILRAPTRRHATVRGISGLAIDGRSQVPYGGARGRGGLQRAQTLVYYPTSTSLRTNYVLQHSAQM